MKETVYTLRVAFGDCDPAGIVWFPNFFRWIDSSSRHFFIECGVPPWHETEKEPLGIIGTPLVDTHATFVRSATYGDELHIHTSIPEWRTKSFVQRHRVVRVKGGSVEPIMECDEVRVFVARRGDERTGIRALPIPPSIRQLCE